MAVAADAGTFFNDLSVLADTAGPWDIVFFSGDFLQSGDSKEFARVGDELEKLWAHLAKLDSHPVLIYVPGNHDLRRPDATAASSRWRVAADRQSGYRWGDA